MGDVKAEGRAAAMQSFSTAHFVKSSGDWWNKQLH